MLEIDNERFLQTHKTSFSYFYNIYLKRVESVFKLIRDKLPLPIIGSINDLPIRVRVSIVGFINIDENTKYPKIHYKTQQYLNGKQVFLEDQTGRTRLIGNFPFHLLDGIAVGVVGELVEDGNFEFVDIIIPQLNEMPPMIEPKMIKIAFISNLCLTDENFDMKTGRKLIEQLNETNLCVFVGNIFSSIENQVLGKTEEDWLEWLSIIDSSAYERMTDFFEQITPHKILIPGFGDPIDAKMPIQPFTKILTKEINDCDSTTNPISFRYENISFLVMSGEVIDAINDKELSFHQKQCLLLTFSQLAPSVPQKIQSSISDKDVFTINQLPNFFVVGGSEKLETTDFNGCGVISIPSYQKTRSIAIYDASVNEFSQIFCN